MKENEMQSLIDESQALMQTIYETSNQSASFKELPESDRLEIYSLTEELNQLLRQLKEEGEAA